MVRESGLSRYSHGQRDLRSRAILSERSEQGGDTAFTRAKLLCSPSETLHVSEDVPRNLRFLVCERDAKRLVNAAQFSNTFDAQPTGPRSTKAIIRVSCIACITVKRKTITIREDQDEWIEDQHLNLSSFVREKLDELIEERE